MERCFVRICFVGGRIFVEHLMFTFYLGILMNGSHLLHKLQPKKEKRVLVPNRFWGRHLLGYGSYSFEISQKNFFQTWLPWVYFEISEKSSNRTRAKSLRPCWSVIHKFDQVPWQNQKFAFIQASISFAKAYIAVLSNKHIFGNQSWSGAVLEVNWRFLSADSHATEIGMKTMPAWWLVTNSNSRLTLHHFFQRREGQFEQRTRINNNYPTHEI